MDLFEVVAKIVLDASGYTEGLDEASAKTDEFKSHAESAGGGADSMGSSVADTAAKLKNFVTTAAGVIATVKTAKWFNDQTVAAAAFGDSIDKNSQKLGISSGAYQRWSFILEHNGASIGSMTTAMRTLAAQTASGNESFQKLGISMEEMKKLSQEDLFARTIEGLQKIEDKTERSRIASELLGRSYMELNPLLNSSAEDTADLVHQYKTLGAEMSRAQVKAAAAFTDARTNLDTALQGLKNNAGMILMPIATDFINTIANGIGAINNFLSTPEVNFDSLASAQEELARLEAGYAEMASQYGEDYAETAFGWRIQQVKDSIVDFESALDGATANVEMDAEAQKMQLAALAEEYAKAFDSMLNNVQGFFGAFDAAGEIQQQNLSDMRANIQSQIDFNNQYADSMNTISQYAQETGTDMTALNSAIAGMGAEGAGYAKAIADAIAAGDPSQVEALTAAFEGLQASQNTLAGVLTDSIGNWDAMSAAAKGDIDAVKNAFDNLARTPAAHLYVYTHHIDVYESGGTGRAGGVDYVPEHNFLALLHEGERVMTKEENKRYMEGKDDNVPQKGITINQYIQAIPQTPADIAAATEMYFEQARWM